MSGTKNIVGYAGKRRKVIVVDDKLYHCLLLEGALKPLGFEKNILENGQQVRNKA